MVSNPLCFSGISSPNTGSMSNPSIDLNKNKCSSADSSFQGRKRKRTPFLFHPDSKHCSTDNSMNKETDPSVEMKRTISLTLTQGVVGLPPMLARQFLNQSRITTLYPWQHELLTDIDITNGRSIVYSLPTSGGKTLVAEILLLRALVGQNGCGLYIVPYIALAEEKLYSLHSMSQSLMFHVLGYFGSSGRIPVPTTQRTLFICTVEKANAVIHSLQEQNYLNNLRCVVVDEIHMLGQGPRGAILEGVLGKLRTTSTIQFVGMSATILNLGEIADWLGAKTYRSEFRPVELKHLIVNETGQVIDVAKPETIIREMDITGGRCLPKMDTQPTSSGSSMETPKGPPAIKNDFRRASKLVQLKETFAPVLPDVVTDDQFAIVCQLVAEIAPRHNVLVFCPRQYRCAEVAGALARRLGHRSLSASPNAARFGVDEIRCNAPSKGSHTHQRAFSQARPSLSDGFSGTPAILMECMALGIGFHHAGLGSKLREVVERCYRGRGITVLCCTSTLAVGVNLPARRVIIYSPYVGRARVERAQIRQMCGRAGRAGIDEFGEAIVVAKNNECQFVHAMLTAPLDPVISQIELGITRDESEGKPLSLTAQLLSLCGRSSSLLRMLLDCFACGLCKTVEDAHQFSQSLFCAAMDNSPIKPSTGDTKLPDSTTQESSQTEDFMESDQTSSVNSGITKQATDNALQTLLHQNLLQERTESKQLAASLFGIACTKSSLSLLEVVHVRNDLERVRSQGLILQDDLHVCYILTPLQDITSPSIINSGGNYSSNMTNSLPAVEYYCDWCHYQRILERLNPIRMRIAERIGVSFAYIHRRSMTGKAALNLNRDIQNDIELLSCPTSSTYAESRLGNPAFVARRFYCALILCDLLHEVPRSIIEKQYGLNQSRLEGLMTNAASFSSAILSFCSAMHWVELEALIASFVKRIGYGVRADLVPLMEIKGVTAARARALWHAGYRTAKSVATVTPEKLVRQVKAANGGSLPNQRPNSVQFFSVRAAESLIRRAATQVQLQLREKQLDLMELTDETIAFG